MSLDDLPEELWKLVLQHVPLQQRLSSCALVGHKLRAAAVAATECIEAALPARKRSAQRNLDSCVTYLQQHGRYVTGIMVAGWSHAPVLRPLLEQLPCHNLQQVGLTNLDLRLGPDQDHAGVFDSSTSLTRLELQNVGITAGSLATLAGLPKLEHLCVDNSRLYESFNFDTVSAYVWATLTHLTHLDLNGIPVPVESLRDLGSMTRLRVLKVADGECRMLVTATPGVSLPPSVQHFSFYGSLRPSVLAAATQLTFLNLAEVIIEGQGGVSGGACLLEVLARLQHLDFLSLSEAETRWPAPSFAYQALVASSSTLRCLDVSECGLPAAAFAFTFPSASSHDVMLTSLEELSMSDMQGDTVADMVKCCPALRQLWINVDGGAHLAALSGLSALTLLELKLHREDDGGSYAVSIQCLSGLTQLHSLGFEIPSVLGTEHQSLLPLTALQQLTRLTSNHLISRGGLSARWAHIEYAGC